MFASRALKMAAKSAAPVARPIGSVIPPFHLALPVHNLDEARKFWGGVIGCEEGRSSQSWIDYNFFGHQLVCHWASNTYRGPKIYNSVDHDMVPVPHLGVCLTVPEFHATAERLKAAGIKWIMEPQVRFVGKPGEQWTMFFEDPSGNNVEIKAMVIPENLFARYFVDETPLPEKK